MTNDDPRSSRGSNFVIFSGEIPRRGGHCDDIEYLKWAVLAERTYGMNKIEVPAGEELDFEQAVAAYPEIPSTVLVKIEALRRGTKITPAAREAIQGLDILTRDYHLFSYSSDGAETQTANKVKIPAKFCLKKDDTVIDFKQNSNSPYTLDIRDNRFFFADDRLGTSLLEEVYFIPKPKFMSKTLSDGTPYQRVLTPLGLDSFSCYLRHHCGFWDTGRQCQYCDIGSSSDEKKKRGQMVGQIAPEAAAKVIKEVFENEPRYRHFNLNGGTILDPEKEADVNCSYLNAINEAWEGVWYPTHMSIIARDEKYLKRIRETGLPVIQMNLEVWDERLFNILCPGKATLVGREEWIRRLIKAVDIFGRGKVLTSFVSGVEMAQPWGFKEAHAAAKNTLEGCDFLMAHDVLPKLSIWYSEHGSALGGQAPRPLEYYTELFMGFLELLEKHEFRYLPQSRCRACGYNEIMLDLWHYLHKEKPAPIATETASKENSCRGGP